VSIGSGDRWSASWAKWQRSTGFRGLRSTARSERPHAWSATVSRPRSKQDRGLRRTGRHLAPRLARAAPGRGLAKSDFSVGASLLKVVGTVPRGAATEPLSPPAWPGGIPTNGHKYPQGMELAFAAPAPNLLACGEGGHGSGETGNASATAPRLSRLCPGISSSQPGLLQPVRPPDRAARRAAWVAGGDGPAMGT
jgi:hypothetical protein